MKRRRKEIDYKILSQRGKNRESNAFALLESKLKNSAVKSKKPLGGDKNGDADTVLICTIS